MFHSIAIFTITHWLFGLNILLHSLIHTLPSISSFFLFLFSLLLFSFSSLLIPPFLFPSFSSLLFFFLLFCLYRRYNNSICNTYTNKNIIIQFILSGYKTGSCTLFVLLIQQLKYFLKYRIPKFIEFEYVSIDRNIN
ncbi:hypothetical protein NEQG_01807 [Nematocida parisii ERTm3]|uniref:Uncharacterized protein n=1 Tax=Nematocida parisii (strain ERTm3) TaxID=935791 RepID=I3EET8_NEMP3|nr:hypothetical protein NEQG_01807 [Nematocida parisii ERTm3]